jgi:hypothetical protein
MNNLCRPVVLRSAWEPSTFRPCGLESRAPRGVAAVDGTRGHGTALFRRIESVIVAHIYPYFGILTRNWVPVGCAAADPGR